MELPPPVDSDAFKEDEYDLVVQSNAFLGLPIHLSVEY